MLNSHKQQVEVIRVTGETEIGEFVQIVNRRNQRNQMISLVEVKFSYPSSDGVYTVKELFKRSEVKAVYKK